MPHATACRRVSVLCRVLALGAGLVAATAQADGRARGCPADFDAFLTRFEASESFRRNHTRFPLPLTRTDTTVRPTPTKVQVLVRRSTLDKYPSVHFPPLPPLSGPPLARQPVRSVAGSLLVRYERQPPDATALEFLFRPGPRCWRLAEVHNIVL